MQNKSRAGRLVRNCGVAVAATLTGIMMLGAGAASAATCSAGSGDYSLSGSVIVGSNLYCAYNAAHDASTDTWSVAEAFAVSIGGTLASVDDTTTTGALSTLVAALNNPFPNELGVTPVGPLAFIGLYTNAASANFGYTDPTINDFKWVNGDPSTFFKNANNWASGTPGDVGFNAGCTDGSTFGNCKDLYTFLDSSGMLGSWHALDQDEPSLNIGAIVELPATVPLPGALPLFAGGLGILGLLARRRNSKPAATAA